jgi:hypothetical protein
VRLDGQVLGVIPGSKELHAGRSIPLPDGSTLHVQLVQNLITPELRLTRDGRPLPRSASDPTERLRLACASVFLIAGLNIGLGLLAELWSSERLFSLGFDFTTVPFGGIMVLLGFFVRRRSAVALWIAIVLFFLDSLLTVTLSALETGRASMGAVVVRLFLILWMVRGLGAIRELRQSDSFSSESQTPTVVS